MEKRAAIELTVRQPSIRAGRHVATLLRPGHVRVTLVAKRGKTSHDFRLADPRLSTVVSELPLERLSKPLRAAVCGLLGLSAEG